MQGEWEFGGQQPRRPRFQQSKLRGIWRSCVRAAGSVFLENIGTIRAERRAPPSQDSRTRPHASATMQNKKDCFFRFGSALPYVADLSVAGGAMCQRNIIGVEVMRSSDQLRTVRSPA
jgi:hypothetical protein